MTTLKSSVKKSFFAPKFFLNTLSKSWTNGLLYFIVFFFTLPVPILISTDSSYYTVGTFVTFEEIVERVVDLLCTLNVASMFIAAGLAVFAGCAATRYLNSKTSTNFYHSLPISREALFSTKTLVGILDFFAALVLSVSISSFVLLLRVGSSPEIGLELLKILGYSSLMFLLVFFVCVFVGTFCGTTGVQFVMTGVVLFIVPAIYSCVLFFVDKFTKYVDTSYYWENVVKYTSPIIRLFTVYDDPLSVAEVIIYALIIILVAFLALLVYKKRPNENAENPIVFGKVATFLKYLIMIPATMALGIWFEEIGGGLWLAFGFAMGALLSSMLINAVFQKNARAMFKGLRGLAIFAVVFTLFIFALGFDILGIGKYLPDEKIVSDVGITIDGEDYGAYKNKELIKALESDLERYMEAEKGKTDEYEVDRSYEENYPKMDLICDTNVSVRVVFHTKLGVPVAKRYNSIPKKDFAGTLKALADSDEFKEHYTALIDYRNSDAKDYFYEDIEIPILSSYAIKTGSSDELYEAYKKDLGDISYESFQRPEAGYILKRVREGSGYSQSTMFFPVFIDSDHLFDVVTKEKVFETYIDSISSIEVYRSSDENGAKGKLPSRIYTGPAMIREIISSVANVTGRSCRNLFCEYDYGYYVKINYKKDADYENDKYLYEDGWIGEVSYFINGKVPAFVEKALG